MTLLYEAVIFLAAAVVAVPLFRRLGFGSVLGYLAAGVVIGPHGFGWIADVDDILKFAKLGVVLLLFLIGLELQRSRLWALRRTIFGMGTLQLAGCALPIAVTAWAFGLSPGAAALVGVGLGFCSTALVLQSLSERGELTTHHGRAAFAIVLFKYIALLPLLAALPLLSGEAAELAPRAWLIHTGAALAVLVAIGVGGRYVLRPVLRAVAEAGTHETFVATGLLVVIGSALALESVGLSMGIGALLAGALLADSEYRHEIHTDIDPFKGVLMGLFFIAVGMSVDLGLVLERPGLVGGLVVALVGLKLAVTYGVALAWGLDASAARSLAVALPQAGELGLVVFTSARSQGVLTGATTDVLVLIVTLSMALTPLIGLIHDRLPGPRRASGPERAYDTPAGDASNVIIAGFGRFGQVVARVLHAADIPFTALEVNPKQVDFVRSYGNRLFFGDASRLDLLRNAEAGQARALVLAIDDPEAAVRTAQLMHEHFPRVPVFARARDRSHAVRLRAAGAATVVRETYPASLELAERVLGRFGWSEGNAHAAVDRFRAHDEAMFEREYASAQDDGGAVDERKGVADELATLFAADPVITSSGQSDSGESKS